MRAVLGTVANDPDLHLFWCPGCGYGHHLKTGPGGWTWNGDMVRPTAAPSLLVNKARSGGNPRCHFFIRDGRLDYCGDSTHALAGQCVPMVPWDDVRRDRQPMMEGE